MSIIQELENLFGITFLEPFDMIVTSLIIFFFCAVCFNFLKLLFRLFNKN